MASVDHISARFLGGYGGVLIAGLSKNSAQDVMLIGALSSAERGASMQPLPFCFARRWRFWQAIEKSRLE